MLNREQVLGMGHIKTSYALNPQNNPGMHYNEENYFGEKCLERQQSCGKRFRDNHKDQFSSFLSGEFQQSGLQIFRGKILHKM